MRAALSIVCGVLVFSAGCRDMFEPPMSRDINGGPPMRRLGTRSVVELAPQPGSAPSAVGDGGLVLEPPKIGIETAANAIPLFDPYMRYDRTTEVTIRGPIVSLMRVPLAGDRTGLFVRVSTQGELAYAYLGPEEWLFFHDIRPGMTQEIFITGSRAELNGQIVMIARKIILNGVEVSLRDANGNPYWTEPVIRPQVVKEPVTASTVARIKR